VQNSCVESKKENILPEKTDFEGLLDARVMNLFKISAKLRFFEPFAGNFKEFFLLLEETVLLFSFFLKEKQNNKIETI
jgi:hypothetical protein